MAPLLGPDPDWFIALKEHSPESIAKVFLAYLRQCLKSKKNERPIAIPYIHDALQRLENKPIALLVIPKALQAFPSRANATQLETLSVLLKLAWHYTPDMRRDRRQTLAQKPGSQATPLPPGHRPPLRS